jgi:AcrR family transcriptional regulator
MAVAVSRREEHALATRQALVDVAEDAFAENGYAGVSIDEICRRARVTKGALYHHFADKRDLFRAVYAQMESGAVADVVARLAREPDIWDRCVAGIDEVLDHVLDPRRQQILLIDGMSVLGAAEVRAMDMRHGLQLLTTTLGEAMDAGVIELRPVDPLARLLLGAIREAALEIALAEDQARARADIGAALQRLIEGLRPINKET